MKLSVYSIVLLFLCIWLSFLSASAAEETASSGSSTENSSGSLRIPAAGGFLRGDKNGESHRIDVTEVNDNISELSLQERAVALSNLLQDFDNNAALLKDIKHQVESPDNELKQIGHPDVSTAVDQVQAARKPLLDAVEQIRRVLLVKPKEDNKQDYSGSCGSPNQRKENRSHFAQYTSTYNSFRSESFAQDTGTHLHSHVRSIHDALANGDHGFMKKTFNSLLHRHKRHLKEKRRPRRLTKNQQCKLLKECAGRLSLYDLYVYSHSDDIDPITGDVDDNVVSFVEPNWKIKYEKIQDLVQELRPISASERRTAETTCDTSEERTCGDGTVVTRVPPSCDFADCPAETAPDDTDAPPLTESEAESEAESDTNPEIESDTAPEADPETADAVLDDTDASPTVSQADPEADPGTTPEVEAGPTQPEAESETAPEAESETTPEAEPNVGAEDDPKPQPEAESDFEPETIPEAEPEAEVETEPEADPAEPGAEPDVIQDPPPPPAEPDAESDAGESDTASESLDNPPEEPPEDAYEYATCDELLGHFHRVVEHNDVPELQPATVSQVCLAEGTTAYVKLSAAASSAANLKHIASVKTAFEESYRGGKVLGAEWERVQFEYPKSWYTGTGEVYEWRQLKARDISVGADNTVVAVDESGFPYKYQGTKHWSRLGNVGFLHQVEVVNSNTIFGRDSSGLVHKYDWRAYKWNRLSVLWTDGIGVQWITACSSEELYAVKNGEVVKYNKDSRKFERPGGKKFSNAREISISADCKVLWMIDTNKIPRTILPKQGYKFATPREQTRLSHISGGSTSKLAWGVNGDGQVYSTLDQGKNWPRDEDLNTPGTSVFLSRIAAGTPLETWGRHGSNVVRRRRAHDNYVQEIRDRLSILIEAFLLEVIDCAEDLHNHAKWTRTDFDEEFVFGLGGQTPKGKVADIRVPIAVDASNRNKYGLIKNLDSPAFEFETFNDVMNKFEACADKQMPELNRLVVLALTNTNRETAENLFVEAFQGYADDLTEECISNSFSLFDDALSLVFGGKPSPGFICGIREAVVDQNKPFPGKCCLDAPFQLESDDWGHPYDCAVECHQFGPLFSGMSVEACEAHGGTFCPEPTDCTELRECLSKEVAWAKDNDMFAYEKYLNDAPNNFTDTTSAKECGLLRAYFGFDETFINDKQVCRDVEQLKHTRDFAFLDEYFSQGSSEELGGGGGEECNCEVPSKPELVFTAPDRTWSSSKPVVNGQTWKATNFALKNSKEALTFAKGSTDAFKCPEGPFYIQNICMAIQNVSSALLGAILLVLEKVVAISEHTYEEMATINAVSEIKISENLAALVMNMGELAEYFNSGGRMRRNLLAAGDGDTSIPAEVKVDLQVEIVSSENPRAFLSIATLQGSEQTPDSFELWVFDMTEEDYVPVSAFSTTQIQPGSTLIKIPEEVVGQVFTLKVGIVNQDFPTNGLANATTLISFRSQSKGA
ncbi:activity domain protein [Seminavis robusta]|uniref:Activity domain protein n=1 Tax=Seminavis robusta TaxID=568900 RepID=A0A9N8DDT1_9STRA|nr:activity domain protein [Seminavis robusta]|eukprot:Sro108_g054220.1 activity domain protein (1463) ;mRNA; r:63162-68136